MRLGHTPALLVDQPVRGHAHNLYVFPLVSTQKHLSSLLRSSDVDNPVGAYYIFLSGPQTLLSCISPSARHVSDITIEESLYYTTSRTDAMFPAHASVDENTIRFAPTETVNLKIDGVGQSHWHTSDAASHPSDSSTHFLSLGACRNHGGACGSED